MIAEGNVAMRAFRNLSACVALNHRRISPASAKQYHLSAVGQGRMYVLYQFSREVADHTFFAAFGNCVYDLDVGLSAAVVALRQGYQPISAGLAVVQGLERRGRGPEDHVAAADASEHDRGVAAVVPRSGRVLLVGGVMFLVDYY